jgi:hypothetical protein
MGKLDLRYKEQVRIDKYDLDNELIKQPELFLKYASMLPDAIRERDTIKNQLEILRSKLYKEVKSNNPKMTDRAAEAEIIDNKDYKEKFNEFLDAQQNVRIIEIAKQSFEQRHDALRYLVRLYIAGYYSDVVVKTGERASIDSIEKKLGKSPRLRRKQKDG